MRFSLAVLLTLAAILSVSCSGGGSSPVAPTMLGEYGPEYGDPTALRTGTMPVEGKFLWGMWQGTINLAGRRVELVQYRQAEFHANLAGILASKPLGLSYKVKNFDMIQGIVSVDVSLIHPYPDSDFRGFDTRGIFMGPGKKQTSNNDPGLIYPAPDGCRILNADGYTRWWNAPEFTTSGPYGYDDPVVIPSFLIPETTLNPFKYFADCLGPDDPVVPNVNPDNRGTFSTDSTPPKLTRNYLIKFPKTGGQSQIVFHYAVDVSWAKPTGSSPSPKPIDDFPTAANCGEPFHIKVDTEGTTAWYKNDSERGGDIQLAVEVFDWQAASNPEGILGEIESIWIESATLFDSFYLWPVIPEAGSQDTSGVFHFTIPDVTPAGLGDQELLITVRSNEPNSYAPPFDGSAYPESAVLSSYAIVEIPINEAEIHDIHVIAPNGYDLLMAGASSEVEWETSQYAEIENVAILISTNSGVDYNAAITYSAPNTGSYIFHNIPETYIGSHNRIKICDTANPSVYDESDNDFTILPELEDQIIVSVPNGGQKWIAGTSEDIKWVGDPNIVDVTIKLSKDSGETWPVTIIDSVPNADGKFTWELIPQEHVGTLCRVGVFDANNANTYDMSDADFVIAEPGIEVDTPVTGEIWEDGNEVEITWAASNIITGIDILLSLDSGGTYAITVADNAPNDGSFEWIINDPGIFETTYARIKIQDHNNPGLYFDESDDFIILERSMALTYPNGGEEWRIGFPQTVEWLWTGNIPLVDIKMSLDGGLSFDDYIIQDEPNTGTFDIAIFDAAWLTDHTEWDFTEREALIKIEASGTPSMNDESDGSFSIPITLGILNNKNCAASGDTDNDGVKNTVETFLGMNPDSFDSDRDGMYDFNELFSAASFNDYDLIPDGDGDAEIAPLDTDDNGDGVHDGELIDSDLDGIPNYLEYYGYTYNWLTDEFLMWDDDDIDPDFTVDYYKTDPLQPSTDQDPYGDGMETSGLLMDQSVEKPGDSPMVPACPDIVVRLEGYQVTLNADIEDALGGSESKGKSWTRETSQSHTSTTEHHWDVSISTEMEMKFGIFPEPKVSVTASAGGSYSSSNTTGTSTAEGTSVTEEWNWSTTRSTNPTEAAAVKLFVKVYNKGTAAASNIIPTLTLTVGRHPVATFEQGNAQINLLPPGGVYPASDGVYWIIDSIDTGTGVSPIYLTLDELKAFESGAPISIEVTQMLAQVAAMNEQGYWEYVGDWGEYMSRVDAVSADIYIDGGDGNPVNYRVYADDDPSAPVVTLGDALIWAAGARDVGSTILIDYKLLDGSWIELDLDNLRFMFDDVTWNTIQENQTGGIFGLTDIPLTPGAVIIGKAPPTPPLDKPQIHWAGYDSENNTVYSSVSDYFAVDAVYFVDTNPDGTQFEMTYDSMLGCYKVELPIDFVLESDVDEVIAVNITGNYNSPAYTILEMADLPEGDIESYPEITGISHSITEGAKDITLNVSATVDDDYYAITEVYLLSSTDNIISQLDYDSESGKYIYSAEIDSDYQPSEGEKIRAYNSQGYSTTTQIPAAAYTYPSEFYNSGNVNWIYGFYNIETNTVTSTANEYSDIDFNLCMTGQPALAMRLASPLAKWQTISCDHPSRSYLNELYVNGYINWIHWLLVPGSSDDNVTYKNYWWGCTIVIRTTEGRLAYIMVPNWNVPSPFKVYSLYNGPWD